MKKISFNKLNAEEASIELDRLSKEIHRHDILYNIHNHPEIEDSQYDALRKRYIEIERRFPQLTRKDSPSYKIGANPSTFFPKIQHKVLMLSLDNGFTNKEINIFFDRIYRSLQNVRDNTLNFLVEPKIDGVSLSLRYENGYLVHATTRGNGYIGENVTENARTVCDIPKYINKFVPRILEVRGEIYMKKQDFISLNNLQEKYGSIRFSNLRNAASGSLRHIDVSITKERNLHFFAYTWGEVSEMPSETQLGMINCFRNYGFSVNPLAKILSTRKELFEYYDIIKEIRKDLEYDIDGIVYKVNEISYQKHLGSSSYAPRWAIAYKFPSKKVKTILRKIEIKVSRKGAITPIAHFDPILIGGVSITSASLHNENYIRCFKKNLSVKNGYDIRLGDTLIVQRSGDVIPKIVDICIENRPKISFPYQFPKICPSCGSKLVRKNKGIYCIEELSCKAQEIEKIRHFVSRDAFNIEGFGEDRIKFFLYCQDDSIKIERPSQIFSLEKRQKQSFKKLEDVHGFGKTSVKKLYNSINVSRKIFLSKFLFSLGIPYVGVVNSKQIASYYKSYERFSQSVRKIKIENIGNKFWEEICSIKNIGKVVAKEIVTFYSKKNNILKIQEILPEIIIFDENCRVNRKFRFENKKIVFTGKIKKMSRNLATTLSKDYGALVSESISSKTDFLIVGSQPGSKIKKAKRFGITIINEDEWLKILNEDKVFPKIKN